MYETALVGLDQCEATQRYFRGLQSLRDVPKYRMGDQSPYDLKMDGLAEVARGNYKIKGFEEKPASNFSSDFKSPEREISDLVRAVKFRSTECKN